MRTFAFVLLAFVLFPSPGGRAQQPLVADLSDHLIAITTDFAGAEVLLFGATDGPGDVIVVLRGPTGPEVVRQKERTLGVWANLHYVTFANAPAYYRVSSNRPLDEFAEEKILARHHIGAHRLMLSVLDTNVAEKEQAVYRDALVRLKTDQNLFGEDVGKVNMLANRLFSTHLYFPANVPVGTYQVEVYLVRNGQVVSTQTTPLIVSKTGFEAEVFHFAHESGAVYGILAIVMAVFAGWLAGVVFRKT